MFVSFSFLPLCLCLLACYFYYAVPTAATINTTAETYVIDTSLPASEYLKEICREKGPDALLAIPGMIGMLPVPLQSEAKKLAMAYWESGQVIEPYHSEIAYLSTCIGASLEDVMTVNLIWDLIAFCSSILAVKKDGTILHARNQDFPIVLRNDTVNMRFVDGKGDTLYESTNFFGYVGIPTGIRYNAFSITIDGRASLDGIQDWADISKGYFPSGWLVRECLIKDSTFDACVHRLSTTQIQAPIYYIIAGTRGSMNGAVITRNQTVVNGPNANGPNAPLHLQDSTPGWYLVETNYDWWHYAKDLRREAAERMLNAVGQDNISLDALYEILSTPPLLVADGGGKTIMGTVYTTRMSPSNSTYYNSQIRSDITL